MPRILARRAADYGVMIDAPPRIDMARVKARADAVAARSRRGVESWLRGTERCTVITAHARFLAPDTVEVGEETADRADASSSMSAAARCVPNLPGIDEVPFLTNSSMLELDRVPEHLVIVGGSYVGLEFAQMYRRFGAEVTVVEMGPRLVGREDEDVSQAIREILEGEGIAVRTRRRMHPLAPQRDGVAVGVECTRRRPRDRRLRCAARGRPPAQHRRSRPRSGRRRDRRSAATSRSTMAWQPTCRGSGRSATATAAAPSPTPPTTISRSSRPTCSTAKRAGSATASWATRSTSIRRSAGSA